VADIEGHPPLEDRKGADPKPRSAMPSLDYRKGRHYTGLRYFMETSKDGHLFHVVCFACGLTWNGRWRYEEALRRDGSIDPSSSVVLPKLEGLAAIHLPNEVSRRCTCTMGKTLGMRLDFASDAEIQQALHADHGLSHQGRIMFAGGTHPSDVLQRMMGANKTVDSLGESV
jgi:hypothetical protein